MRASSRILVATALVAVILAGGLLIGNRMSGGDRPSSQTPHASRGAVETHRATSAPFEMGSPVAAEGPSFDAEITSQPTAEKNQSKLWIHDGHWWATMMSAHGELTIHWLEWATQQWHDTGVLIDERGDVRSDALAAGDALWVVTAGRNEQSASSHARALKFTYDSASARYVLDTGFPIPLSTAGVTGVTVALDSAGQPWVAYVAAGQVWFTTTDGAGGRWIAPRELPAEGTAVGADEAAVVSIGDEVGIMWSNQLEDAIYYASHRSGESLDVWSTTRIVVEGLGQADDHLNVKAVEGAGGGVFAVAKTSLDEVSPRNNEKPLIILLALREGDDTWRQAVVGTVGESHSRPILLVDPEHGQLHVFATSPGRTGDLYYKHASVDDLAFRGGLGEPFLDAAENSISNPTSTKQAVSADTGIVVLAADASASRYVHAAAALGGVEPGSGAELPAAGVPPEPGPGTVVLFDETFDYHTIGTDTLTTWETSANPLPELSVVETEEGAVARLVASPGVAGRVCRAAPVGPATSLVVSARVQAVAAGTNDFDLLAIRGTEGEVLSLSVLPDGRFVYSEGAEKVAGGASLRFGSWYRLTVTIDIAAGTYDWELRDAAENVMASGAAATLRADGGPIQRVCFRTAAGGSGTSLLVDDVRASR